MSGAWERMFGIARRILDAMFSNLPGKGLTHEVLCTLVGQVCAIMNSITPCGSILRFRLTKRPVPRNNPYSKDRSACRVFSTKWSSGHDKVTVASGSSLSRAVLEPVEGQIIDYYTRSAPEVELWTAQFKRRRCCADESHRGSQREGSGEYVSQKSVFWAKMAVLEKCLCVWLRIRNPCRTLDP